MYEYRVNIVRVIDGDTVDVDIDLGFGVWLRGERVRMMGIDTPESRTSDKVEKVFGLAAKECLKHLLGKTAVLKTQVVKGEDAKGKFGRILGDFDVYDAEKDAWRPATKMLMEAHHCVPYFGESKDDVQAQHMVNRRILIESGRVNMTLAKAGLV
jgi:micrococcal nuclease|tara:strand:+ start:43952 stop:44416 length:465 start_codon:yes stop_codon:yes gene_type:complete